MALPKKNSSGAHGNQYFQNTKLDDFSYWYRYWTHSYFYFSLPHIHSNKCQIFFFFSFENYLRVQIAFLIDICISFNKWANLFLLFLRIPKHFIPHSLSFSFSTLSHKIRKNFGPKGWLVVVVVMVVVERVRPLAIHPLICYLLGWREERGLNWSKQQLKGVIDGWPISNRTSIRLSILF